MCGFDPRWATETFEHRKFNAVLVHEYSECKSSMKQAFNAAIEYVKYGPCISIQLDLWTSKGGDTYGTLIASAMNSKSGARNRFSLATRAIPGTHGAAEIAVWIKEVLSEWDLPDAPLSDIFIYGTADGAGKELNALDRELGIKAKICKGHRLNTAVQWATGIAGKQLGFLNMSISSKMF